MRRERQTQDCLQENGSPVGGKEENKRAKKQKENRRRCPSLSNIRGSQVCFKKQQMTDIVARLYWNRMQILLPIMKSRNKIMINKNNQRINIA